MHLGRYTVLGLVLAGLCGCAGFKERFKPEDAAWAGQKGTNIVAVKAYAINDRRKWRCDEAAVDGALMPDTPYYRDWMRVIASPLRFKSGPGKKAFSYVRRSDYQPGCMFVFHNVPAGKWLFMTSLQHHVSSYTVTDANGNFTPRTAMANRLAQYDNTLSEFDMIWAAVDVPSQKSVVARQVYEDYRKRKDVGMFRVHNLGRHAEVADWTPTEAEAKELGLDGVEDAAPSAHP